jgi:hypothetical protein
MHSVVIIILVMTIGLLVGRHAGWLYSRAFLYPLPTPLTAVLCIGWGCLIAYLTRYLIEWQHVGIMAKVIIYGAGAYISIPNYDLFAEDTIPYDVQIKHQTINILPLPTFVLASIALALFIKVKAH